MQRGDKWELSLRTYFFLPNFVLQADTRRTDHPPLPPPLWCDTPAVNLNHCGIGGSTVHSINTEIRATVASLT